ncbi:MAG: lysylphosphatidylglycerol synthase transmembrane domain-containing protein [Candidatus Binataceae bacterium]
MSPKLKIIGENLLLYSVAAAIIWYESRGLNYRKEIHDLSNIKFWWFLFATLGSFAIWFFGENLFFSRLFTRMHQRTGYIELLPATCAAYFLQIISGLVANGAFILFLHRRKKVPWFAAGFTMTFFGFIDGILFSSFIAAAGFALPSSPIRTFSPYALGALFAFMLIAAWWLWRKPGFRFEKWLYNRPSLMSFRKATPAVYGELLAIRFMILAPQGLLFWMALEAFNVHIPIAQVLAMTPGILAVAGASITPAGLGPMQAVAIHAFSHYAPESKVMAATLAFSISHLLYRIPLGLGPAGVFVRQVLEAGGDLEKAEALVLHRAK